MITFLQVRDKELNFLEVDGHKNIENIFYETVLIGRLHILVSQKVRAVLAMKPLN